MGSLRASAVIEFGEFRVNVAARTLARGRAGAESAVALTAEEFDALALLVSAPGHVVRRSDPAFVRGVSGLRTVFGETPGSAKYIEMLPGWANGGGFRFVASLRPLAGAAARKASRSRSRAIRLYALAGAAALVAVLGGFMYWRVAHARPAPPRSIAITRFRFTGSEREEALALSLAGNLKDALALSGKVTVREAQAVASADPAATARAASAEAFLSGRVIALSGAERAVVSLIGVSDGKVLWTGQFDSPAAKWFEVEDLAASRLLDTLFGELPVMQHHTADPAADQLYWRGRAALIHHTHVDDQGAAELFQMSTQKDSADAFAWAGLADAWLALFADEPAAQREMALKARIAAVRAVALDPTIAEPHAALAMVAQNYDWDWPEAEREYKRSLVLNPNYPEGHHRYGQFLVLTGHPEEGIAEIRKASHLDPLSPAIAADYAMCLYLARHFDELAALKPDLEPLGMTVRRSSREELQRLPALKTDRVTLAVVKAALGDKEGAFALLDQAFENHDPELLRLKADPGLDSLRTDPRLPAMLGRMRL